MPHTADHIQEQLHELNKALENGSFMQIRQILNGTPAADIAHLIESSRPNDRAVLWRLINKDEEGEVLQNLSEEIRSQFLSRMDTDEIVAMIEDYEADDVADVLQELPAPVTREVLASMGEQDRQRLETVLSFPEDTAGGLMNTDTVTIRPNISLDVVLRYLRRYKELPATTDNLLVVNRKGKFVGILPLTKLLVSNPSMTVRESMITDVVAINANTEDTNVASLFERHDLVSAPVVDDEGLLVGRITIDDVVDVIREDADHSLLSMAGLDDDEDTFAPVIKTSQRRAVWLGINLITAVIASLVISQFQEIMQQVIILAVLMPIVASMGGVAGTQTLTIVVRGMALGHIGKANAKWLLAREVGVSLLNGLTWATVMGAIAVVWFDDYSIGIILGLAMIINLAAAGIGGAGIPLLLQKIGIDPALAGSVLITTVTDVIGFLSFLGLATAFYVP